MRNKLITLFLAGCLLVSASGCHRGTTPVTPKQPDPPSVIVDRTLLSGADCVSLVASGIKLVDEVRKQLETSGQIDATQSQSILKTLKVIALRNEAANQAIELTSKGNDMDWKTALLNVTDAAKDLSPEAFGIKNPNAVATFKAAVATLINARQVIQTSFGGTN